MRDRLMWRNAARNVACVSAHVRRGVRPLGRRDDMPRGASVPAADVHRGRVVVEVGLRDAATGRGLQPRTV